MYSYLISESDVRTKIGALLLILKIILSFPSFDLYANYKSGDKGFCLSFDIHYSKMREKLCKTSLFSADQILFRPFCLFY